MFVKGPTSVIDNDWACWNVANHWNGGEGKVGGVNKAMRAWKKGKTRHSMCRAPKVGTRVVV